MFSINDKVVTVTAATDVVVMPDVARLLPRGDAVVGGDDLNTNYDPSLKNLRGARLSTPSTFRKDGGISNTPAGANWGRREARCRSDEGLLHRRDDQDHAADEAP